LLPPFLTGWLCAWPFQESIAQWGCNRMYAKRKIADIVVPKRLREIDLQHVGELKRNMAHHGLLEPVVVDASNTLICGAHRLQAAKDLGWAKIDCHVVAGITDALLLEMAENSARKQYTSYELYFYVRQRWEAASEASSHRMGRRKRGATAVKRRGKTTDVIGRECGISGEQVRRIKLVGDAALSDCRYEGFLEELRRKRLNKVWRRFQVRWNADRAVEDYHLHHGKAGSRSGHASCQEGDGTTGPLESDHLYNGDCRKLLPSLPDRSVHAVICDLPYGAGLDQEDFHDLKGRPVGIEEWLGPVVAECKRVVIPGGLLAFFVPSDLRYLERCRELFGDKARLLVGVKRAMAGFVYDTPIIPSFDTVVLTYNAGARPLTPPPAVPRRDWFEMSLRFDPEAKLSPYPKCLDLCEYLVEAFTLEGGIVLDPCMGSGSIPIAASRKGRHWIGIEVDQFAFDLARIRMAKYGDPIFDYWAAFGKS